VQGAVRVQVPSYALRRNESAPIPAPNGQVARAQAQQRAGSASGIDANGVAIMRAGQFISQTETSGTGAMVGVQSTGVASLALIQGRGELPAVQVLFPSGDSTPSSLDEGTALLEEVHAVAPGAGLAFCGPNTFVDYTSCLTQLVAAGATILVDDMSFPPQDLMSSQGSYPQAVESILSQNPNVAMFSAAGNAEGSYWEGAYAPVPVASAGLQPLSCSANGTTQVDNYVAVFNGSTSEALTYLGSDTYFPLVLAWADPYGQNASNFDLYLFSNGSQMNCFSAAGSADTLISTNLYSSYTVYVGTTDASLTGKFLKLWAGGDGLTTLLPATTGGFISPQLFASGVNAIGAVNGSDGIGDTIESYSSQGPLNLIFPTPQQLPEPALVAPDGINVDAVGTAFESYLFPDGNFYGTSASVANAGGVAALLQGAFPSLTALRLEGALQCGAAPLGTSVPNVTFGNGRIDAIGALSNTSILPLPTMSALSNVTVVGGSSSPGIPFTVSGFGNIHCSATSSNAALVPAAIVAAGAAGVSIAPAGCGISTFSCTLSITPAIGQVGGATLTVSALDCADHAAPATMTVTVTRPAAPTLTVNAGANQEFTAGSGSASPVAFAITGTGPLTVTTLSSNAQLVPASGLVVSAGCGSGVNTCMLTITTSPGTSGSATITITVTDTYGQSMSGPVALKVDPGADASAGSSASPSASSGGGGGAFRWWELAWIAGLAGARVRRRTERENRIIAA
jgi:hypothetical protein